MPQPANTLVQRRRAQRAIFENWLTSEAGIEALKAKPKCKDEGKPADEVLSIASLMAKHESALIIKNPRQYQIELFERAQRENTIAVLDTGSGKTLIAVLLLRWTVDQELERRSRGEQPKVSLFVVDSVTLVYQQYAVLEQNADYEIAKVCGGDGIDLWHRSKWTALFKDHKVVVLTADIVHSCLSHGFIGINQINLLVFDEAHHAKKNHVFARIIKDYYMVEEPENRPRIFGMTASPIDAKTDVTQAASELEAILHSKIATTNDASFTEAIKRPEERILRYAALQARGSPTALLKAVRNKFPEVKAFDKQFSQAIEISRHLGFGMADAYLVDALSDERQKRYEADMERKFHGISDGTSNGEGVKLLDKGVEEMRQVIAFVAAERPETIEINEENITTKVKALQNFLQGEFERPSSHRCIIFVEARQTARLLAYAFEQIGTPHLHPGFLIGANANGIDEDNFTFRSQVVTMMKFRKGEINCLFATTVAEEGLDVPDCNIVVRFDMYKTMIQYVQSRGRARKGNSKFIHMIEMGNHLHESLLSEVRYQEATMRQFCQLLPEDRKLEGNEDLMQELAASEKKYAKFYVEPSTKAKLTYGNALGILANLVSAIPTDSNEMMAPTYIVSQRGNKFVAEVLLPGENAPLRSVVGDVRPTKALAKRAAAFAACFQIRKRGYLDEYLLPVYEKQLPAMRNALLAVTSTKMDSYAMRTKPKIWNETRGTLPSALYIVIVDFPEGLERPHQTLAMLTRTPLAETFPRFDIYLGNGTPTAVHTRSVGKALQVSPAMLEMFTKFTFRVLLDVFSKEYEEDAAQLSYWLAPLNDIAVEVAAGKPCDDPETLFDWDLLRLASTRTDFNWTAELPPEQLLGRFIVDPWDGSRKYYVKQICYDKKPLDPVPEGAVRAKWMKNILEYSNYMFKSTREKRKDEWDLSQPVFEAEKCLQRRNLLEVPTHKESAQGTRAWLCPQPLRVSVLPPTVAASAFLWPAVIYRLEQYLIAEEACELIGVKADYKLALEALTKDTDSRKEEHGGKVQYKKGMGDNYERLEFIGDTFLKTATTISTFIQNPGDNEFEFHVRRMVMLCNKNLYAVACELKLFEYIRTVPFSRRLWYPEGLNLLKGKGKGKGEGDYEATHSLGIKTIADVSEALIGAAYVSHNRLNEMWHPSYWDNAVRAVTKLVSSDDHVMLTWKEYSNAYVKPEYQLGEVTASQRALAEKVETEHNYHFKYPHLLRSAFIHPSQPFMFEKLPNYERLEFLGDALLDMASITYLFHRYPDKDPQWLTEHKMAMVSNKFLGAVCVNIGFHKHIRHNSPILQHQIQEYTTELLEAKAVAGDARDYWTTVSDPPKCLPDLVESFTGAMFIDSDFDYNVVQQFFDQHMKWYFEDMTLYDTFANSHPCTHLHNLLQITYACQDYCLMAKELPTVDPSERKDVVAVVLVHETIVAHSKGKSGRYARLRVAQDALQKIEGLAPFEFREKYDCQCHLSEKENGVDRANGTPAAACTI
ncbi:dsRNA-specific nuclease [Piedraia hortae CBS 480.64]|uniref:Dicer-like protein 1 n=1 Tax=Piedraia hortae CBS 480.64 TaxID=1314780 RepID=A0A6A7C173_9PEZI|nr:dsRNA-specific nuclease [Piedraia hortae CBS 480.64]